MISRIAAAFVLVFYIALLTDAGLEFLGLGDMTKTSWGVTLYWAQVELDRAAGRVVAVLLPRRGARASPSLGLVLLLAGIDEVSNPRLRTEKRQREPLKTLVASGARAGSRREDA